MPSRPSPTDDRSKPRPGEYHALLLAGPPASAGLWHAVLPRWEGRLQASAVELFDPRIDIATIKPGSSDVTQ